jgi:hypothetical protein
MSDESCSQHESPMMHHFGFFCLFPHGLTCPRTAGTLADYGYCEKLDDAREESHLFARSIHTKNATRLERPVPSFARRAHGILVIPTAVPRAPARVCLRIRRSDRSKCTGQLIGNCSRSLIGGESREIMPCSIRREVAKR